MYNPYDLLVVIINGEQTYGRPIEFDSEVKDQNTMENAFGRLVKPIKCSTTCPSCGAGLILDVMFDYEPPFRPVIDRCKICRPDDKVTFDPFVNPLESRRITKEDLDAVITEADSIPVPTTTVADRMQASAGILPELPPLENPDLFSVTEYVKPSIDEAEGMGDEVDDDYNFDDFDDEDLQS